MGSWAKETKSVLLILLICYESDDNGRECTVKALLDCGSVSSLLSEKCIELMKLKGNKINIVVWGLNDDSFVSKIPR